LLQRFKRDYQDDPKDYLDKVIEHWIYKIPVLIDIAVAESEKDLKLTVAKRVTQVNFGPNFNLFVKSKITTKFCDALIESFYSVPQEIQMLSRSRKV
jgi:hypothetical protein